MADGVADLHLQEKLALMKKGEKKLVGNLESGKTFHSQFTEESFSYLRF